MSSTGSKVKILAYGYPEEEEEEEERTEPIALREVTFVASPDSLREIAAFLLQAASTIEAHADKFGHAHLCHSLRERLEGTDVIVANPIQR